MLRDGSAVRCALFAEVTRLRCGRFSRGVGRVAAPAVLRRHRSRARGDVARPRLRRGRRRAGCGGGLVGQIVAHAASFRIDARRAEVAFLVTDDWQGRGLGSLLLSRLAEPPTSGVTTLVAEVLPHNRAMITVFERSGYPVEVRSDAHGVEVEIDLAPGASAGSRRLPAADMHGPR